jgi:predicted ATPase
VKVRRVDDWRVSEHRPDPWSSILSEVGDAEAAPEVLLLRRALRSWRFYDQLRTDADAPARNPAVGTRTPVLASDGHDVAAAIQTIREMSGDDALDAAIERAFPGSKLTVGGGARFELGIDQHGLLRPLEARELSDGTLRYILLVAALLSPRPASLLVLNEPETSLHPDLVPPLAELVVSAARRSQIIVVSHSKALVTALADAGALRHELVRELSETKLAGQTKVTRPPWHWPMRTR